MLTTQQQLPAIAQLSDLRPCEWSYQTLVNLSERYGCVSFGGAMPFVTDSMDSG